MRLTSKAGIVPIRPKDANFRLDSRSRGFFGASANHGMHYPRADRPRIFLPASGSAALRGLGATSNGTTKPRAGCRGFFFVAVHLVR
jgi:hypothetical protein